MPATTSVLDSTFTASIAPSQGPVSGLATVAFQASERVLLARRAIFSLTLDGDAPVTVDLAGLDHVDVLGVRIADGAKVTLALTSSEGAAQEVPCDSFVWLSNVASPFTVITLTRTAGAETTVELFLGQRA